MCLQKWYSAHVGRHLTTQTEGAVMRLHIYRDQDRSAHLDLVGEGDHPWTVDLVTVIAAAILVVGFAGALGAHLVQ